MVVIDMQTKIGAGNNLKAFATRHYNYQRLLLTLTKINLTF